MKSVVIGEMTIGEIVADDFRTATIFERHGIDFCCGGKIPLAEACKSKGIELDALTSELESLQHEPVDRMSTASDICHPRRQSYFPV